jgi:hypothetical protein
MDITAEWAATVAAAEWAATVAAAEWAATVAVVVAAVAISTRKSPFFYSTNFLTQRVLSTTCMLYHT